MNVSDKFRDLLHELDRTRWARLQNTQFVYWSHRQQPKIEKSNGTQVYLRPTPVFYRMNYGDSMQRLLDDMLRHREDQLFNTDDEAVVYWRGWSIFEQDRDHVFACAEYCMAHIWDDEAHDEPRYSANQFRVDPLALHHTKA